MFSSLFGKLRGKTILHMGCKDCGNEESYLGVKVLNKVGIEPEIVDFSCGCEYFGIDEEKIRALVRQNKKLLKGATIIAGCARCYHVLREYYDYADVKHISHALYEELINADSSHFIGSGDVFYHDPCFLSRYEKLTENPRRVLDVLGYNVREFKNNREKTDCCGDYTPIRVLRERASEMRLSQIPKKSVVTSACPKCTQNFRDFVQKEKNRGEDFNKTNDKTIKHFLDLVDHALNIEIPAEY
jgi:Fe-S oxidoreductase